MSPTVRAKLRANDVLSIKPINGAHVGGDNTRTINDVKSLKKGIIKTSKIKAKAPYTILLVGETGVGKSSILEFISNVITGNDIDHYDFDILDRTNEQGGPDNQQSQTNAPCLYEITSKNGIGFRVLDTPGFTDPRHRQQDERHNVTKIEDYIDSVTAVLVLANGTVPGVTVGTTHALSTLSSVLPKTLANNIGVVLTNISSPIYRNFAQNVIPDVLKDAPQFLLSNPIALQKKYLKVRDEPNMKKKSTDLRNAVMADEQNALEMLVALFDWLDGLEPQSTTGVIPLY